MKSKLIKQALAAYNSPNRHNYELDGKLVSNLDGVQYHLSKALPLATGYEQSDILTTMANIESYRGNVSLALNQYQQALTTANRTQQTKLHSYLAIWQHAQGNQLTVSSHLKSLNAIAPESKQAISDVISVIKNSLASPISYHPPKKYQAQAPHTSTTAQPKHAIVTLGYKLNANGAIAEPLLLRLQATLAVAALHPRSQIIVTGGVKTAGTTEAEQMKHWLVSQGVNTNRIVMEDQAANTIENAKNSLAILHHHHIQAATIVSASIHVHRSQILFDVIQQKHHSHRVTFNHMAVKDGLSETPYPSGQTRLNCYIDALRGYGMPAFDCGGVVQV
ncbi:hypothetical protein C9I98_07070 [Photobacterium sanctipauli]|uniref:DUF218 domain-containing protein n=1 Tax=Photobacterium sanctipauli TaxID=1342794 RepID=A0A2T3NWI9_9GAMM|nr:YdcF family protein [Photobacterium sanctipauli]PSW20606.1 hypothetical protein C9I98_07070 [Photobacterium sanctipauli]